MASLTVMVRRGAEERRVMLDDNYMYSVHKLKDQERVQCTCKLMVDTLQLHLYTCTCSSWEIFASSILYSGDRSYVYMYVI